MSKTAKLTRSFSETVKARLKRDPEFRASMVKEAAELIAAGDQVTGEALLRLLDETADT